MTPAISITGPSVKVGAAATKATFTVTLSAATTNPVTVSYSTAAGTAKADTNFAPITGSIGFPPGQTSETITVNVAGMPAAGLASEIFSVNLASPSNATIAKATATATLVDTAPAGTTKSLSNSPNVTTNPSNETVPAGQPVTFTAAAKGTPTPTVQWQVSSNNGSTYTNILGATSATYTFSTLANQTGNLYRAVFTNSGGTTYSNPATLTCNIFPVVTSNPASQTVNAGQSATLAAAVAAIPTASVQWQVSTNGGSSYSNISGAVGTSLSLVAAANQSGDEYRAVFTNSLGTAYSNPATLTVSATPVVTTNPVSQAVPAGQPVTFTAAATGTPAPTVQWQVSNNNGSSYASISGATAATYTFTTLANQTGNLYRAAFTNSAGTTYSNPATLTCNIFPNILTSPVSQSVNAGQSVTFTAVVVAIPTAAVQWQVSSNSGASYTNIPGATTTPYAFQAIAAESGDMYRVVFTNSLGTAYSNPATLTVSATPVVTTNPVSQAVPAGQPVTFTAAATGTPAPTVQWQVSNNNGSSYASISGATAATYTFTTLANQTGNLYRAVVYRHSRHLLHESGHADLRHFPRCLDQPRQPVGRRRPVRHAFGHGCGHSHGSRAMAGERQPRFNVYQYPRRTSASYSFQAIVGESGNLYRAVFTNSLGTAYANPATLTVSSTPASPLTVTTNPVSKTVFAGTTASFTAAATGSPAPSVQWQVKASSGGSFVNIPGATSTTYSFTAVAAESGNQYQAVFTNVAGSTVTTSAAALKVNSVLLPKPTIVTGPAPKATTSATPALATTTTATSTPSVPAAASVQASTLAATPVVRLARMIGSVAAPSGVAGLQPSAVDAALLLL